MAFTIVAPSNGTKARKSFSNAQDKSDFRFANVWLADEQPLQDPETASLEKLKELIEEVNRDSDNAFLIRGYPHNRNSDNTYGLDEHYWFDKSSNLFQIDLDYETDSDYLNQNSPLHERVMTALEDLSFLKGTKFLAQLSSGAGLPKIGTKNYPKKLCLRLFVETKTLYTLEQIAHYLKPYMDAGLVDNIFQPTRRLYIQPPELINTPCVLANSESLRMYEGELLDLEGLNESVFNPKPSKKTKEFSKKLTKSQKKRFYEITYKLSKTDRAYWGEVLDEYAKKGHLTGIRNDLFKHLFRQEAFFNYGDCALLIDEIMSREGVIGDRDRKNLEAWEKIEARKLLSRLRQDAQRWSIKHPDQTFRFDHIDLQKRDWSDLKIKRAAAIKSGCGTNKTKGVIYDLVKWSKETNQSLLIVSPFVAVTESIAKDVGINHYHSIGDSKQDRLEALTSKRIATCYQSLNVLDALKKIPQYDIVIIDEASLVWRGQGESKEFKRSLELLFNICDSSKHIYALCADIDEHTLWCLEQIENHKAEDFALYLNSADWGSKYEIECFEDYEMILQDLIDSLNKGKRVAVAVDQSDKKGWITAFKQFLKKRCVNAQIKGFDAETVKPTDLKTNAKETISKWLEEGMDCLIVSPFCSVGWDYLSGEDQKFDEVYVIGVSGFLSAQRLWQWIRRFRLTRKAKYYAKEHNQLIFDKPTRKVIEREKVTGKKKLTRIEDWQIETRDALTLDQANVGWYFRELCKDKGARLTVIPKPEDKKNTLKRAFAKIRKAVHQKIVEKLRTEKEEYLKLIESFGILREGGEFVPLHLEIEIEDAALVNMRDRDTKVNEVRAERFGRCFSWEEQDLKALDDEEIVQFNVLLWKIYDALWFELNPLISDKYLSFSHWYTKSTNPVIHGRYKENNFNSVQALLSRHWDIFKQEIPRLGRDCLTEPNRVLMPLIKSLDLVFQNRKDRSDISATEAKQELYYHYHETSEPNFNIRAKDKVKLRFCLEKCYRKQKEDLELLEVEEIFLQSRPESFSIRRNKFISSAWFERMDKARQTLDDRSGVSTNHTQYCSCEDCKQGRTRYRTS